MTFFFADTGFHLHNPILSFLMGESSLNICAISLAAEHDLRMSLSISLKEREFIVQVFTSSLFSNQSFTCLAISVNMEASTLPVCSTSP